jgi:hypothetical protein
MEREIDLTPRHLVDWLKAEIEARREHALEVRASREFLSDEAPATGDHLDPEDDVSVLTTVGTLEVRPSAAGSRWLLRLRVEDPIGSHLPDDGSVPDGPEEIGLEEFESCFVSTDDLDATVTVETNGPGEARDFDRILGQMLADRHIAHGRLTKR